MEHNEFRRAFFKIKNLHLKLSKCEAREWLLKVCSLRKLVPKTLRPRNRDPKAHQQGYGEEEKIRWKKAQLAAGLRMVEEAKGREATQKANLLLKLRRAEVEHQHLNDEAWLALRRKVNQLKATKVKLTREQHGVKLRNLLQEDGRQVPRWLDRTGSHLEGTASVMERSERREEEQEEAQRSPATSTPIRNHPPLPGAGEIHNFVTMARRREEERRREREEERRQEFRGEQESNQHLSIGEEEGSVEEERENQARRRPRRRKIKQDQYKRRQVKRREEDQPDLFTNYANVQLTDAMRRVLNLGPGFVPDRVHCDPIDIRVANMELRRRMRWDFFFQELERRRREEEGDHSSEEESEEKEQEKRVLRDREQKVNLPKAALPAAIKEYEASLLLNLTKPSNLKKIRTNIGQEERAAIRDLKQLQVEKAIVIKEADKGGGWGILPFEAYNNAMLEKLGENYIDTDGQQKPKYPPSSKSQLKREYATIKDLVEEGRNKGYVGEKDAENAMPATPTPARLYGNPKTHKQIPPGKVIPPLREIVAGTGSNCEGLGKLIDAVTRPVDEKAASFIMDTPDLLRKVELLNSMGEQPIGTHLFTVDVVALYPSVPTSRAPEVLKKRLLAAGLKADLVDWVVRSTQVLLKSNTFEYDSGEGPKLYTQADGAGIGQANACAYAGIFMAEVEEQALFKWRRRGGVRAREKGSEWRQGNRAEMGIFWRFRDDCIGLFRGTRADFMGFLAALNEVDPAIRFTEEGFGHAVNFLDVRITLGEDNKLHTTLYVKPNTKNQLLLPTSAHPPFVTKSSAYSLFLRLRRICSEEETYREEADKLQARLEARLYNKEVVEAARLRATLIPRSEALKKVVKGETNDGRQHRLVCRYDRRTGPALRSVMEDSYQAAKARDVRFSRWFPKVPKPAFRRGKTLREELVRAKLTSKKVRTRAELREGREGVRRCSRGQNSARCQPCSYLTPNPASIVKEVTVNGKKVRVEDHITCKTESVIYVIMSRKAPDKCYGGQTGGTVGRRLGQHRRDIINRDETKAVARHFMETGSTVDDLVFVPIKVVRNKNMWARLEIERQFLNEYNLLDDGINVNL